NDCDVLKWCGIIEGDRAVHQFRHEHRSDISFQDVEGDDQQTHPGSQHSEHIRAPGVAAAVVAYIDPMRRFRDNYARGNGTHQVTEHDYDSEREHENPSICSTLQD